MKPYNENHSSYYYFSSYTDTSLLNKTRGPKERTESPDKTKPDNLHLMLTVIESERTHAVTLGENHSYFRSCLKFLIQAALEFTLKFSKVLSCFFENYVVLRMMCLSRSESNRTYA